MSSKQSRDEKLRIQDILESVVDIQQRTKGMTFTELESNKTITKAVLYDFTIIGEAAKSIPDEIQSNYPQIPWRLMGNMRNVVVHEYFQVNLEIVWDIIQNDLPLLAVQLQELLQVPLIS